jgi:hypothetical protein
MTDWRKAIRILKRIMIRKPVMISMEMTRIHRRDGRLQTKTITVLDVLV